MAKLLKLRRGTTTQHSSFTGAEGEVTIDTDKDVPVVHDGSTAGGHPVAAEDMANVSSASIAGRLANDSIAVGKIAAGTLPSDVKIQDANVSGNLTIESADIVDGTIVNADVNASAAIAGTKISPNFGSQSVVTTGNLTSGDMTILDSSPSISFSENDADPDYKIVVNSGQFRIYDTTNSANRIVVQTDGTVDITGNLDANSGLDVTGNITSTGNLEITNTLPKISLVDSDNNDDFDIKNHNGTFIIADVTDSADRMTIASNGQVDFNGNVDCNYGLDVSGNLTVTGTVDGVDIAARDTLFGGITANAGIIKNTVSLADGVTATTQGTSDNTTKVATTAYVTTAVANAEPFPSGTVMLFRQNSAPTGWTKQTTHNNKALRVVSGNAGSGGNATFTAAFASYTPAGNVGATGNSTASFSGSVSGNTGNAGASTSSVSTSGNVNNHTLSNNEMPSHSHNTSFSRHNNYYSTDRPQWTDSGAGSRNFATNNSGGGGSHSHGFSGSSHSHNVNNHTHSFSGNFSGNTGNHTHNAGSFSGTARDFAVQYIDIIVCSKD